MWITQDRFCFTKLYSIPKGSPPLQTTLGHVLLWSALNSGVSQDSFGCKWWESSTNGLSKRDFITEHNWKVKASGVARSQGSCNVSHVYLALSSLFCWLLFGQALNLLAAAARLGLYSIFLETSVPRESLFPGCSSKSPGIQCPWTNSFWPVDVATGVRCCDCTAWFSCQPLEQANATGNSIWVPGKQRSQELSK